MLGIVWGGRGGDKDGAGCGRDVPWGNGVLQLMVADLP